MSHSRTELLLLFCLFLGGLGFPEDTLQTLYSLFPLINYVTKNMFTRYPRSSHFCCFIQGFLGLVFETTYTYASPNCFLSDEFSIFTRPHGLNNSYDDYDYSNSVSSFRTYIRTENYSVYISSLFTITSRVDFLNVNR